MFQAGWTRGMSSEAGLWRGRGGTNNTTPRMWLGPVHVGRGAGCGEELGRFSACCGAVSF